MSAGTLGMHRRNTERPLAGEKIDFAYSSQLRRAHVTAQTIASVHNLEVTTCPELNEIDVGELEGLNFNEVSGKYPDVARLWIQRSPALAYPSGESLPQLERRVMEFRTRLTGHAADETILIVAHSGILRTLICQLLDLEMRNRWI
jgi:broad specificity phosphatase PhoE